MSDRDHVEAIMYVRYAGVPARDKRLNDMLAGLCSRYPMHADSIRYWFDHMLSNRPAWWHHAPLFHIHACGHVEQRFAPTETEKQWLRYRSQMAWAEFLAQRKRDNALLRANFEFTIAVMRDDPATKWDKAAFKADYEGDAL